MLDNENVQLDAPVGNNHDQARERLLDAAGKLFAEKGFDGTSVRSITKEASCNIAAVNYHFGNKDKLYFEVVTRCLALLRDLRVGRINELMDGGGANVTLEELLEVFANAFLDPLIDESTGPAIMQLMHREMIAHHIPRTVFLEETILPVTNALKKALLTICPYLDEETAILVIHSIVGQLMHVVQMMQLLGDAAIAVKDPFVEIPKVVDHIVRFSATAIRSYADGQEGGAV